MTAEDRAPVEVELKYRVLDIAAAERYLTADEIGPFAGGAVVRSTQMEDRYVDTASGALAKAGFAARLRKTGRGTIISVKALARGSGPGGAARRVELEGPADRRTPQEWPASDARALILELAGDAPLIEVVTIRQLRRRRIARAGETRVEFSLDEVDVVVGSGVVDRFVEFEAELVKGDDGLLAALAVVLDGDPGLASEKASKLQTAMAAVRRGGWNRRRRSRWRQRRRRGCGRDRVSEDRDLGDASGAVAVSVSEERGEPSGQGQFRAEAR